MLELFDKFTGANGTHLQAHSPNFGGPWSDVTAGWQIQGNACLQTVDASKATVPLAGRTQRLFISWNFNGCDANNELRIVIDDVTTNEELALDFFGNGNVQAALAVAGSNAYSSSNDPPLALDPAIPHSAVVLIGPDRVSVSVDGQLLFTCPRATAKSTEFVLFTLGSFNLNAAPGIKVTQVSILT